MRINFPNSNYINRTTRVLKKEIKKDVSKLSTQKLKNSICQSFGYQNYSDFQLNNSTEGTPNINDVLLDDNLTSELNSRLLRTIVDLLVSDYGFTANEAENIAGVGLEHTEKQRLTNASLDSIKDYIRLNNHVGYFGYEHWFYDAEYDAEQLDEDSAIAAVNKLVEYFENWDGKDIKSLIESLDRLDILCSCNPEYDLNSEDFLPLLPINKLKYQLLIKKLKVVEEYVNENLIVAVDEKGGVLFSNNEFPIKNGHTFIGSVESMYQVIQEELEEYQSQ